MSGSVDEASDRYYAAVGILLVTPRWRVFRRWRARRQFQEALDEFSDRLVTYLRIQPY